MSAKENTAVSRNYGVDLLRIISIFFICILHILNAGGITAGSADSPLQNMTAWLLQTAAYCAVNCYALISGYVGCGSKFRYFRIINLYFEVIFYTVAATVLSAVLVPGSIGLTDFVKALFPFVYGTYWYFTAYFCMFFFIPFLNLFIEKASCDMAKKFVWTVFVVISILPTFAARDIFFTRGGYISFWLALLYLIGGFIKKYKWQNLISAKLAAAGYILCVLFSWFSKFAIKELAQRIPYFSKYEMMFINYISPTIILAAIMLLIFMLNINFSKLSVKVIGFFSPVAFGVYLIHENPFVKNLIIKDRFASYAEFSPFLLALAVIGTALSIWFVCSLIDRVRFELFRLIKVREFSIFIEKSVYNMAAKIKMILRAGLSKRKG